MGSVFACPMYTFGTALLLGCVAIGALVGMLVLLRRLREREADPPVAAASEAAVPADSLVRQVRVGKLHQQGQREYQQDTFGLSDEKMIDSHGLLAVVADGMGGLAKSERVSIAAVETILDRFALSQGQGEADALLVSLAAAAQQRIDELLGSEELGKSGSTLIMGLIRNSFLYFLGIGDSRICLLRGGVLMQLNREHIYANELALQAVNGELSAQDAFTDPQGGGLTSYLGMARIRSLDLPAQGLRLFPGDKVVLMSDGVYNALEEEELTALLTDEPQATAERLRSAIEAKQYSNQDNYTAVILECLSQESGE